MSDAQTPSPPIQVRTLVLAWIMAVISFLFVTVGVMAIIVLGCAAIRVELPLWLALISPFVALALGTTSGVQTIQQARRKVRKKLEAAATRTPHISCTACGEEVPITESICPMCGEHLRKDMVSIVP